MKPEEFVSWLTQFLSELGNPKNLSPIFTNILKEKLNSVFNKVTPDLNSPEPEKEKLLNDFCKLFFKFVLKFHGAF